MVRSRLKSSKERQAKQNLFLSIAGLIALVVAFIVLGIPLIINLSLFVEKKMDPNQGISQTDEFIPPPQLDISYTATNSGVIAIPGTGDKEQTIYLYVNDERVAEEDVEEDGTFIFDDVKLKEGDNEIYSTAKVDKKTSSESNILQIRFLKEPPTLTIDSPADLQTFKGDRAINITGKTDDGSKVTVNGFWAVMQPDGEFRYRLNLQDGENTLEIVAEDEAGNRNEKELKVNYAP